VAEKLAQLEHIREAQPESSQRQLAEMIDIPRGTLRHWQERQENIDADPAVVAFFSSPAGIAFLHRLVLAVHFVMSFLGPCGVRLVCTFLELSGLAQFVAASYGTQREVSVDIEEAIVAFEKEEEARLGPAMKAKEITVAQDETYHERPCLVAIEPVSGYILLEAYAENRQAETWTQAMAMAVANKPIEVIQSTSDEGRGICSHVANGLGVHHSPDVFHVQQEVSRATSGPLTSKVRQAEKEVAAAEKEVGKQVAAPAKFDGKKRRRGRRPDFAKRIAAARQVAQAAHSHLAACQRQQERVQQANQAISRVYHPYNLETGVAQNAAAVAAALAVQFGQLEAVTQAASLSEKSRQRIAKARRVVVQMVATIAFFWLTVRAKIEALQLPAEVETLVYAHLLPAFYLQIVAHKAKPAQRRQQLEQTAATLLAPLLNKDSPVQQLPIEDIQLLEEVAWECVHLFQPSSSCVEGRNGQLALRHHALHRLSDRKLNALKVVHNFYLQRDDGTTAAERFFDAPPTDLFAYLLEHVDIPGFPAQKRPRLDQKISLVAPETDGLV
jgi:hypothetical protein